MVDEKMTRRRAMYDRYAEPVMKKIFVDREQVRPFSNCKYTVTATIKGTNIEPPSYETELVVMQGIDKCLLVDEHKPRRF